MNNYKELNIWKRSIELVKNVYLISVRYPKSEKYVLVDQIQRAAISVPSNIVEGTSRATIPQTKHFINIASSSLCELETQIIISAKLAFIKNENAQSILNDIVSLKKMTWSFHKSLKEKETQNQNTK